MVVGLDLLLLEPNYVGLLEWNNSLYDVLPGNHIHIDQHGCS